MARKLFYRIGEACKKLDIQPYVLRYWETEFPVLNPRKSKSGQRVYSEEELRLIERIKQLLYDEGFTIAGAKKKLEAELVDGTLAPAAEEDTGGPGELDTDVAKRIEQLEAGLRAALEDARHLLEALDHEA